MTYGDPQLQPSLRLSERGKLPELDWANFEALTFDCISLKAVTLDFFTTKEDAQILVCKLSRLAEQWKLFLRDWSSEQVLHVLTQCSSRRASGE